MAYSDISNLPNLFATQNPANKFGVPQSALPPPSNTLDLNKAYASGGLTPSVGIKTKSPQDNIKAPVNTTSQPGIITPQAGSKTTDGGTQSTVPVPAFGSVNADGSKNMFDPNTGKALIDPNPHTPTPDTQHTPTPYSPTDTGLYGKLITDLANRSQQSGQDYQNSQAEAKRISDQQTALANDYAQKTNNIAGTAGFLTQQSGLQGQLQNQYNTGQNALASQYAGATNRLGAANTQQGLLQQALQQAGGMAAPTHDIINVNPVTGQPVNGGSLNDLARTAGTISGIQTGAANLASTGGNIASQQKTQIENYKSAQQQGQNLASQATDLIDRFGLNPNELNKANGVLQTIASNTSNPNYQALNNYLADISSRYSQVLTPPGGTSTDTTRGVATGMLNSLMKGSSLKTVLDSLDQQANAVIAGVSTTRGSKSSSTPSGGSWNDIFGQ